MPKKQKLKKPEVEAPTLEKPSLDKPFSGKRYKRTAELTSDQLRASMLLNSKHLFESFHTDLNLKGLDTEIGNYKGNAKFWIPSDIEAFNYLIGGGLPAGRLIEIYGAEAGGKTAVALNFAAAVQRMGGIAVMIDTEMGASPARFRELGVDTGKLQYWESKPPHDILTIEKVYTLMEKAILLIHNKSPTTPVVLFWDSVAGTPTEAELNGGYGDVVMAAAARAHSQGLKKIMQYVGSTNTAVIFINQIRDKMGGFIQGAPQPTGGKAIKFYASVRINVKKVYGAEHKDAFGNIIGNTVELQCIKNKVGRPFRNCKVDLFYDSRGWERELSLLAFLKSVGFITVAGSWQKCTLPKTGEISFQSATWPEQYQSYKKEFDEVIQNLCFS